MTNQSTDRKEESGIDICNKCGAEYVDVLGIGCCGKCFYGQTEQPPGVEAAKEAESPKEATLRLCRTIYPHGDNHYARPVKGNKWMLGYTNDYPLQHGNGESCIIPDSLLKLFIGSQWSFEGADQEHLWAEVDSYFRDIFDDRLEFVGRVELRKELKEKFTITRKSDSVKINDIP